MIRDSKGSTFKSIKHIWVSHWHKHHGFMEPTCLCQRHTVMHHKQKPEILPLPGIKHQARFSPLPTPRKGKEISVTNVNMIQLEAFITHIIISVSIYHPIQTGIMTWQYTTTTILIAWGSQYNIRSRVSMALLQSEIPHELLLNYLRAQGYGWFS